MAVMMGALLIHGIAPGPQLMGEHPDLFWGLAASFWIGNLLLLILNIPLMALWIRVLRIPYRFLYPAFICLFCIGFYSFRASTFDIGVVLLSGLIVYFLLLLPFSLPPTSIGFILG